MSRQFIFDTLSKQLQAQDISHTKVAEHLQLTVTATKLIFETQDCTLSCIEKICGLVGLKLEDLIDLQPKPVQLLEHLTQQHEIELLANKKLFAVVKVNKTELVTLLQRLEEMGVVQVSPGNQFKLTISKKFSWIPDGPIMRMTRRESADYFAYSFEEPIDLINSFSV